jgi:cytochrome c
MRYFTGLILILALVCLNAACAEPASPDTTPAGPLQNTSPPSVTVSPSATVFSQTYGQLAEPGAAVYANRCAGCHGDNGESVSGPSLIGDDADLQKYGNVQALLDYTRTTMPPNAPNGLLIEQYQQVLGFILIENDLVSDSMVFNPDEMANIPLNP